MATHSVQQRFKRQALVSPSPNYASLFYTVAAFILLALTLFGFQHFYLYGQAYPGRELTAPIRKLIILHGVTMSAWVLLFLAQPLLIVTGNRRIHMMLGRFGAALAACIFVLGFQLGIEATRINPADMKIWGLSPKEFMAVPIVSVLIFAGFVLAGVWNRRRPEVHRPMMLLATLAAMSAAISRIDAINVLYQGTLWETIFGPFFATLVVGALFLSIHWLITRSLDRWLAIGYAGLVVANALIVQLATTDAWDAAATLLLR